MKDALLLVSIIFGAWIGSLALLLAIYIIGVWGIERRKRDR